MPGTKRVRHHCQQKRGNRGANCRGSHRSEDDHDDDNNNHENDKASISSSSSSLLCSSSFSFPYETKYNDHFETRLQAYQDLDAVILEWIATLLFDCGGIAPQPFIKQSLILYDPYYCQGQTKRLLQRELGYKHVIHKRRDFYQDIVNGTVPSHYHVLVTNPPYSEAHKQKCLDFVLGNNIPFSNSSDSKKDQQQQLKKKPFCLLMPVYVAGRQYFRQRLLFRMSVSSNANAESDTANTAWRRQQQQHEGGQDFYMLYLVPAATANYQYRHFEGTGHDTSPFVSCWFCGIPKHLVPTQKVLQDFVQTFHRNQNNNNNKLLLFDNWEALSRHYHLIDVKRPNPRQRNRRCQNRIRNARTPQQQHEQQQGAVAMVAVATNHETGAAAATAAVVTRGKRIKTSGNNNKNHNSKYRDEQGQRKKMRF